MATGKVFTGCRARFQLGGKTVGYATGVTLREVITYEPIKVLDSIQTREHAPIDYDVSLTADFVRIVGESVKTAGYFPQQGKNPAEHLVNIISSGELTAAILDNQTGDVVRSVEGVRMSESNMTVTARGVVGENATMVAIRARDEADVS